jgi:hypothetical protein
MPAGKYKDLYQCVGFPSVEERQKWLEDAQDLGIPFGKYILEMARRGKEKDSSMPNELTSNFAELREENQDLRRKLTDTEKLLAHIEAENFKLTHSSILESGDSVMSEELVNILREGSLWQAPEILRRLRIDANDDRAIQIVQQHLRLFKSMGLVKEEVRGWRWIG